MRILCADALPDHLLQPLRDEGHEVEVDPGLDADSLPERLADDTIEVLVVRSTRVTDAAFAATDSLGLVVRAGAGTDNIDKEAASNRGIYVSNVPGQNAIAVAELAMGLLLAIDRHIAVGTADLRAGTWNKKSYSRADGILGKTLAIVGLGEIGFALAERAVAFGMSVTALRKGDRSADAMSRIRALGIRLVDDDDTLLGTADVVSLHVPRADNTVGLVDREFLAKMRDGAILINTARGDLIDADALIDAMDNRGFRAGLDVWPDEPAAGTGSWTSPLSTHPNVVGSHHIGASTQQAQTAIAAGTVAVIEAYLRGRVLNCVNLIEEPLGEFVLTVRHLDKVGVLAKIFETLRAAHVNVQQMENQVFTGSVAAVASINLDSAPPTGTLDAITGDDDVLALSLVRK